MNFAPHPEQHYPHPSKTTFQDMERSPKLTIHNLSNELLITIFDFYRQDVKESYYRWSMRLGLVQAYTCFQKMAHRRTRTSSHLDSDTIHQGNVEFWRSCPSGSGDDTNER